jgi:xanthine/uracil permease
MDRSTEAGGAIRATDLLAGLQWAALIIPPGIGMWVFGAGLVGLPTSSLGDVLAGAFLAIGVATLLQLWLGWRVAVFEGPSSVHLAMVVVVATVSGGTAQIEEVAGGIIGAGVVLLILGASRADRVLRRLFTHAATAAFIFALMVVLLPDALPQAIGRSDTHLWGTWDAWLLLTVGLVVGVLAFIRLALRPFALLVALSATVVGRLLLGWPSGVTLEEGWAIPMPFWWGVPRFTMETIVPFALVGIIGGFNIVGSLSAMSSVVGQGRDRPRRGLVVNGLVQGIQSAFVGFMGTVGHLESASVVRMLPNNGRRSLGLAALALVVLAFVDPVVRVLASIPIQISAVLLLLLMLALSVVAMEIMRALHKRTRWLVVAPSLLAPAWWVVARPSGEGLTALLNPIVLAVVIAIVAERLLIRAGRRASAVDETSMPDPTPVDTDTSRSDSGAVSSGVGR